VGASPLFCWSRVTEPRDLYASQGICVRRQALAAKRRCLKKMELDRIREAAERVAHSEGLEVFDVEWKIGRDRFLRIYLDRLPGPANPEGLGVSHSDCERVSKHLSVILDVEELVPGSTSYTLEVSSPGLDRKLIKAADYERFVGRLAKIWLSEPVENQKYLEGRLAGYSDGMVKLTVKDREFSVPYAAIKKANLKIEF
jgi:ribosome maturation factor RimP